MLVGGLGLGYTAWAALGYECVRSVSVIELLPEVIEWHETGRVPLGRELTENPRCRFLRGDFFQLVCDESVRDLLHPEQGYGAILVDIDHAPDELVAVGNGQDGAGPESRSQQGRWQRGIPEKG